MTDADAEARSPDPLWYKDALLYEVHVRAFADADGDGIGDFAGLTGRLGYLRDLGVTALWLLPFYPSPLKDDGYDIASYHAVHPDYGTLDDFRAFLEAAHAAGLRVITELVLNHTSDQHAWFQRARQAPPGSPERAFYVWSDTPDRYAGARIIFRDFERSNWTWDPVAGAYYWHRFYAHQPDLNFENPAVRKAMFEVTDFWLGMGVDGLRLDAVPYLFEREGTSCENLPETHAFLRDLRAHVDARFPGRMLLAEANQWPEDAVAYFGEGDECHVAFHFPLMPRMFMSVRMEDRFPLVDIVEQTPPIPERSQWALFLRNHDELTLEMVTDEDRDYMYRTYARDPRARINLGIRRRLAPLLGNDRRRIELMHGLLFSLPGTPVLYYGDEIGMGDNIYLGDRNAVRTPMQWSSDRNAGFSRANPQRLYLPVVVDPEFHYEAVNVDAQQQNPHSLLWWVKRLIALRRRTPAFGRGSLQLVPAANRKVVAFVRSLGAESILVVANLSRFAQAAELDLSRFRGTIPVEMFGRTPFPAVGEAPYVLTLGPHAFHWLRLRRPAEVARPAAPELAVPAGSAALAAVRAERTALAEHLPAFLSGRPWFPASAPPLSAEVAEILPLRGPDLDGALAFVRTEWAEQEPETWILPLALDSDAPADEVLARIPGDGVLRDASADPRTGRALRAILAEGRTVVGEAGTMVCHRTGPSAGEATDLALRRRLEPGIDPDLELARALESAGGLPGTPPVTGWLSHVVGRGEPVVVAVARQATPSAATLWEGAIDAAGRALERVLASGVAPVPVAPPFSPGCGEPPAPAREMLGTWAETATILGRRVGAMHRALARLGGEFAPEPFPPHHARSLVQALRALYPEGDPELAARLDQRARQILERRLGGGRIRTHGDLRLERLLWTGKDVVIPDFLGDPSRPAGERRLKRSPVRDLARLQVSIGMAAQVALRSGSLRPDDADALAPAAAAWSGWAGAVLLGCWWEEVAGTGLAPEAGDDLQALLGHFMLEFALRERTGPRRAAAGAVLAGLLD